MQHQTLTLDVVYDRLEGSHGASVVPAHDHVCKHDLLFRRIYERTGANEPDVPDEADTAADRRLHRLVHEGLLRLLEGPANEMRFAI